MPRKKSPANVVGPQIQNLRYQLGLTQEQLSAKCQMAGLDISRATLAQIEARFRRVTDEELFIFSTLLNVTTDELYPPEWLKRRRRRRRASQSTR
jgi:transcriptional regulator with XRE-family HTH domain